MLESLISNGAWLAIFSLIIAGIMNVLWASKLKQNSNIKTFRYTELYKLNAELNSLPPISYDLSNINRLVADTTDRHGKVKRIYHKSSPLLEEKFRQKTDSVFTEEETLSKNMLNQIYGEGQNEENSSLKELLLKRQEFEKQLQVTFHLTMTSLLR